MPSTSSADRIVRARGSQKPPAVAPIVANMTTAKELQVRPAFGVVTPGVQNDIRRPGQDVIIIDSPTEDVPPA